MMVYVLILIIELA